MTRYMIRTSGEGILSIVRVEGEKEGGYYKFTKADTIYRSDPKDRHDYASGLIGRYSSLIGFHTATGVIKRIFRMYS